MEELPVEEVRAALSEFLKLFNVEVDLESKEGKEPHASYAEIISKTQDKLGEMQAKEEEILERTKMTREEMDAYASNRANFTQEQWEALTRVRNATEELKRKAQEYIGVENLKRKVESERTHQLQRFGKKKRWMPI